MKNGYIIQGPVVRHSPEAVVLAWPNGKVTIYRRFIESLVLDPQEEKKQGETSEASRVRPEVEVVEKDIPLLLPENLEDLKREIGMRPESTAPVAPDPVVTDAVVTSSQTVPEGGVPLPVRRRTELEDLGLSIELPEGWSMETSPDGGTRVSSPALAGGVVASLSILAMDGSYLPRSRMIELVKEEQTSALQGFELVEEGERAVGFEVGHQITGVVTDGGGKVKVTQVLVEHEDRLYLFTSFAPVGDDTVGMIEASLHSVEFRS